MIKKTILIMSLLMFSSLLHAMPAPFVAEYAVHAKGMTLGNVVAKLSYKDEQQYVYERVTKATGLAAMLSGDNLLERSEGNVGNDRFVTQKFTWYHKNKRKNKQDAFQRTANNRLQGEKDGSSYDLQAQPTTIDMTIMQLQLMHDAKQGRKTMQYAVIEKGKLKNYRLQQTGTETLSLPAGDYHCKKFDVIREGSDQHTSLWLAEELGYFPVRIRHDDDGDVLDAKLKTYQPK
jgi:hypothetical protein